MTTDVNRLPLFLLLVSLLCFESAESAAMLTYREHPFSVSYLSCVAQGVKEVQQKKVPLSGCTYTQ